MLKVCIIVFSSKVVMIQQTIKRRWISKRVHYLIRSTK